MKAVWLEGGQVSLRQDVPVPDPPTGEALIRVTSVTAAYTSLIGAAMLVVADPVAGS